MTIQIGNSGTAATAAQLAQIRADLGLPKYRYRQSGRFSAPISTFNGSAASGAFGIGASILIPANTLVDGAGLIVFRATARKTGTDAASYFQIHGGPTNGTGDANLFGGGSNVTNFGWSASGLEVLFEGSFAYKSGGFGVTLRRSREGDGSLSQQVGEFTGTWNNAVDNYLNLAIAGATAGNTYDLLDYDIQVFP